MDTLQQIYNNTDEFDAAVRSEAQGLLNKFDSFDTLVTLLLFDDLFEILAPLNLSLQTRNIDLLVAISLWKMQHCGDFFLRNRSFITSPLINYLVRGEEAWNLISTRFKPIGFSYFAFYFRKTVVFSDYKQRD